MKKKSTAATISLSFTEAELHWLAAASGIARLPITLPPAPIESLSTARQALQARELIQVALPTGWQVDPVVLLALHWMATAPQYWVFQQFWRTGIATEAVLFLKDQNALLVTPLPNGKQVSLCEDMAAALALWQQAFEIRPSDPHAFPTWDIPQPTTVIRSLWRHPNQSPPIADPAFATWAASLDWVAEWAMITAEQRFTRICLAAQGSTIWAGVWTPGRPGEFPLVAFQPAVASRIFQGH